MSTKVIKFGKWGSSWRYDFLRDYFMLSDSIFLKDQLFNTTDYNTDLGKM